jgi:hypothetical protein
MNILNLMYISKLDTNLMYDLKTTFESKQTYGPKQCMNQKTMRIPKIKSDTNIDNDLNERTK